MKSLTLVVDEISKSRHNKAQANSGLGISTHRVFAHETHTSIKLRDPEKQGLLGMESVWVTLHSESEFELGDRVKVTLEKV